MQRYMHMASTISCTKNFRLANNSSWIFSIVAGVVTSIVDQNFQQPLLFYVHNEIHCTIVNDNAVSIVINKSYLFWVS